MTVVALNDLLGAGEAWETSRVGVLAGEFTGAWGVWPYVAETDPAHERDTAFGLVLGDLDGVVVRVHRADTWDLLTQTAPDAAGAWSIDWPRIGPVVAMAVRGSRAALSEPLYVEDMAVAVVLDLRTCDVLRPRAALALVSPEPQLAVLAQTNILAATLALTVPAPVLALLAQGDTVAAMAELVADSPMFSGVSLAASPEAVRAALREPCRFASGPIDVSFVAGELVTIRHDLGRQVGHLVIWASGPIQTWQVESADPYRVLCLKANVSMGVKIVLV